ncbi:3-isopropylmalate dehydrogenase [Micromonospora humidisoli]|uniref:isocitrate/isopropylmalate dehydrogenase family protein n=1 Tax=Micromonospora sp. AKA109 TaxID=2733865 RepID=UPI0022BB9910|nr:isocitrate/isopropylmalate family dehydrogenase [Micromonospora sp. AKA109]GHJ11332.1 3-isopropylmalate dehydrogenase [Micromonospora sp. AKA109]
MTVIAVVPGDGIGPEVTDEAVKVLDEMQLGLDFDHLDAVNATTFQTTGTGLSSSDFERIRSARSVLFGAIGAPGINNSEYGRGVLIKMRFALDLYVNHRPAFLWDARLSPLRDDRRRNVDCVIVRENSEGLYVGVGGRVRADTPDEIAIDEEINTYHGVSRVLDYAFSIARRSVCLVDKSNAVPNGGRLWQRCWRDAVEGRPDIDCSHLYVDAAAMKLIADPSAFDVIVTNNSYGDILSDLTAQLAGGLGMAASANLNPKTGFGVYEPVHGSAPDIAGQGRANPVGAILSAALLCEGIGLGKAAAAIRAAVSSALAAGRCTPDIGGSLSTREAGAAIRAELR